MSSISGSKTTPTNLFLENDRQLPAAATSVDDLTSRVSLLGRDSLNPLENRRVPHNIHDRTELDHSEDNFLESSSIDKDIFRSLPGEILFKIFDGFSSKDLNEIRTTNQYLKQSVDNYIEQTPKGLQRTWKASANFKINKIQGSPTTVSKHILDLDLSCFSELTPENLGDFLRFFPNTTKIRLPYCIENNYLEVLASMTQLQHLNLYWCWKITNAGLIHLAPLTQLQHLDLSGLKISIEGLVHLKPLDQLQYLDVSDCTEINNSTEERFKKEHPTCQIIRSHLREHRAYPVIRSRDRYMF